MIRAKVGENKGARVSSKEACDPAWGVEEGFQLEEETEVSQ